jgi:hypothetical protein
VFFCRPRGARFIHHAHPALKRWAKLFRPASRDWIIRRADKNSKEQLMAHRPNPNLEEQIAAASANKTNH